MDVQYPLVFFTLFICLVSGMFLLQGCLLVAGKGTKRFHAAMLVVEFAGLVIGGLCSFFHLHHWERIFNGFGHLTSGITQELIGIVVMVIGLAVVFGMLRKAGDGAPSGKLVPAWVGIVAIVIGVAMGFVCAHSYYMPARPAWANATLYLYYYASEFVLGAVGTWLVAAACKEDEGVVRTLAKLSCIAGIVSAAAIVVAGVYYTTIPFNEVGIAFHTTDPTAPAADPQGTLASPLAGANALLFWGGSVVLGSLVAAVCGFFGWKKPIASLPASAVALVCALVGGVCFRIVLYAVGVSFYLYF